MKKLNGFAAFAAAMGMSFVTSAVSAQIRDDLAAPAEVPSDSYSGRQYVDSRGCIYIRAGIDGSVTWVPRVDRNRKVICGQQAAGGGSRVAEAPKKQPEPVNIVPEAPAATPVAAPAPRRVVREAAVAPAPVAKPRPVTVRRAPPTVVPATRVVVRPPAPAPAAPVVVRRAGVLPPNTVRRYDVSCSTTRTTNCGKVSGPVVVVNKDRRVVQTTSDGVRVYAGSSGTGYVTGKSVVAPKAAFERGASHRVPIPKGYQPAFKDGRLSTTRAHQTLDGRRKMLLIWTNTVPRRLIDKYTGDEVSVYFPKLQYPYTSMRQQQAAGIVSSRGEIPKAAPPKVRKAAPAPARAPVPHQAASHRYIEVGSFSSQQKAQAAIRNLQSSGLPVRINEFTRSGTHYRMVLVGPFQRQDRLRAALDVVRNRIGYRSASLRN